MACARARRLRTTHGAEKLWNGRSLHLRQCITLKLNQSSQRGLMSTDSHAVSDHKHHFAHHFKDAMHEFVSSKEGIWLFMVTEILMFGGLFVGYFIMHQVYPEMFKEGASHLDWRLGSINTLVLILSSWTMAM